MHPHFRSDAGEIFCEYLIYKIGAACASPIGLCINCFDNVVHEDEAIDTFFHIHRLLYI